MITNSDITDANTISTKSIHVDSELVCKGLSRFQNDVVVSGSLSVSGSIVGSGPYVDSSDSRFKKNVESLTNALSIVNSLNTVRMT